MPIVYDQEKNDLEAWSWWDQAEQEKQVAQDISDHTCISAGCSTSTTGMNAYCTQCWTTLISSSFPIGNSSWDVNQKEFSLTSTERKEELGTDYLVSGYPTTTLETLWE